MEFRNIMMNNMFFNRKFQCFCGINLIINFILMGFCITCSNHNINHNCSHSKYVWIYWLYCKHHTSKVNDDDVKENYWMWYMD